MDAFLKLPSENKEMKGSELAIRLGISEKTVKEWARALEASGSARITYKMEEDVRDVHF